MTLTTEELINAIAAGDFDESLSLVAETIQARQKQIVHLLVPGDVVRFNGLCRPKYMVGATATVDRVKHTNVVVVMTEKTGKYPQGCKVTVPPSLLERA